MAHFLLRFVTLTALIVGASTALFAQEHATTTAQNERQLFAVQIRTGPRWDEAKPPPQQLHFREHSANLRRLREAGHLVMGARYADVGFIVLAAESEAQARHMMDGDPSIEAEVFRYEIHRMNVFYPGTIESSRSTR